MKYGARGTRISAGVQNLLLKPSLNERNQTFKIW
jgi:hypothetical protein